MQHMYKNYLSEEKPLSVIKEKLAEHKKLILESPTGSGKTFTFINFGKSRKGRTIFLVPNVSNVLQISKEYEIQGVHGSEIQEGIWEKGNVVVATYDKAGSFLNVSLPNLLVVLDEAHNLQAQANFRSDAILGVKELTKKAEEVVYLSATINHLKHELYGKEVVRFKKEDPQSIIGSSKILISGKNSNRVVALDLIRKKIEEGKQCLVKMNSKSSLRKLEEKLKGDDIITTILTAENKESSEVMNKIVTEKDLLSRYNVILCTSVLDAGINLKSVDVIIDIENGDPNAIKQLSARPREALKEHYVIVKGKKPLKKGEEEKPPYTRILTEGAIDRRLKTANNIVSDMKKCMKNLGKEAKDFLRFKFSLVEDSLEEEFFVKIDTNGSFYVDIEAVRNAEYEKYYRSLQSNPELLKQELEAYELPSVIEEYSMNNGVEVMLQNGEEVSLDKELENLSEELKKIQGKEIQQIALECYLSKEPEKYFESQRIWKNIKVPFNIFKVFGMYMALGFGYRLAYELMMKTYIYKPKRTKVRSYIQAYVYSGLKDDPNVVKDTKGYKAFKILYNLYASEDNKKITKEDENTALAEYSRLLGKKYKINYLTKRGKELVVLEDKSSKKDGQTIHLKVNKGLHTAETILREFNLSEQKYIDEFQNLLDKKIKYKLVNLYIKQIDGKIRPEKVIGNILEEGYKVDYKGAFYLSKFVLGENDGKSHLLPSPYFEEEKFIKEIQKISGVNIKKQSTETLIGEEVKETVAEKESSGTFRSDEVITSGDTKNEELPLGEQQNEIDLENPFD